MKKSFAENCIRYISTATALILALAMLCCANFSASAKDLGSNLTITDTTLLLQDINTTTNTTPAKTKELIASGASVDVVSTGISGTYYLDLSDNYSNWEQASARFAICTYTTDNSNRNYIWYNMEKVSGEDHIYKATVNDSNYYINFARMNPGTTTNNWDNKWDDTGDLTPESGKNCYKLNAKTWSSGGGTWSSYSATTSYTVTFHANGHGTRPDAQTVTSGGKATVPTPPTAEGWTFVGWYTESSCTNAYNFDTPVTDNLDLYAKWTENASSDVSADIISVLKGEKIMFYVGEYTSWNQNTVYLNTTASSTGRTSVSLTLSGSTSPGPGSDKYNFVTLPAAKYYITHDSGFSYKPVMTSNAVAGNYYLVQDTNPKVYSSSGAKSTTVNEEALTITTSSTAGKSGVGKSYSTVYYIKSGSTYSSIGTTESAVNTYLANMADGTYTLYTCDTDGSITVLRDTDTFTKLSVVKYDVNVHYNSKGGNDYTSKIEENTNFLVPTSTIVEGYTLEGWYTTSTFDTGTKVTFPLTITGNTDLYAKWEASKYSITYKSGSEPLSGLTPSEYTYGVGVTKLPTPSKEGYTFKGWYDNEGLTGDLVKLISQEATGDKTFYAKWEASKYSITYKSGSTTLTGLEPSEYTYGVGVDTLPTPSKEGYTFKGWYDNEGLTGDLVKLISQEATGDKTFYAKWELNTFKHKYVFLDASGCDWFYDNKCVGVVYFNNDNVAKTTTGYTEMKELFTDDSGYESGDGKAQHSKLLFAEVPSGTTKITFARHGSGDYNNNYNITNFGYSNFTTNNCFKITGGGNNDSSVSGTWSEKTYNPVPIDFSVVGNGSVAFKNTVSPEITVSNGGTIYADKASTALKVKATPSENYEVSVFTINTINSEDKLGSITDISAGGTVDVGALGDTNTVEVTFKASQSPKIKVIPVANSSIRLSYTDPDGTSKIGTAFNTEYEIQYNSSFTLEITPASGYYVKSVSNNLTPTDTLPKAGTITATATQVKENLNLSYTLEKNPTVTIAVPANCTVEFAYTNDNGVSTTATTAGTYSVYYGSDISYKVTPNDGFYVATMEGVTNKSPTPPVAGEVTGSIPNITADVTDTITCTINPNPTVTIKCYDSTGNEIKSGAGITVDGVTGVNTTQTKTVLYKDSTGATFTASVADSHKNNYVFLGYYNTPSAAGNKYANGGYNDHDVTVTDDSNKAYDVTVTDDSIKVYNVCSNRTIYAIFAQLYEVKFSYKNLSTFTVNSEAVANGGAVYVKEGTSLSLATTFDEDYKMTNDCWKISPTDVGTFTRNASNATYVVGNKNVTITITPEIATYTGQGKWGSRLLRIETSGANGDAPWFAAKFEVVKDSNTTYEWVRFSEVKTDNYECVIPDNATSVEFCRMKPDAKAFSADGVWNVTSTTLGNSDEKYILYFDMTDSSNWVFKCRKDTSG